MKTIHWILFAISFWIILVPFVGDDILILFFGEMFDQEQMVSLLRWDDLFLGLAITVLALIAISLEQGSNKYPGLKAMHWMQVMIGAWIAAAPFALNFTYEQFTWSHFVTGMLVTSFALMHLTYEP